MKVVEFQIEIDKDLRVLIGKACKVAKLSECDVVRKSIELGASELIRRHSKHEPSFVDYLRDFRGLPIPKRRYVIRRRKTK